MPPLPMPNQGHYQVTQSVLPVSNLPPMTINPFPPPQATSADSQSQPQPQIPTTNLQVTPTTTSSTIPIQRVAPQQSVVQASPVPPAPQTRTQESLQLTSVTTASLSLSEGPLQTSSATSAVAPATNFKVYTIKCMLNCMSQSIDPIKQFNIMYIDKQTKFPSS